MAADLKACEAVLLDLLAQVHKFCDEQGEADFETGAAEAMKRQIVGQNVDAGLQRQLDRVLAAYGVKGNFVGGGDVLSATSYAGDTRNPGVQAHSKSEYKRRVALGDPNVLPPAPGVAAVQPSREPLLRLLRLAEDCLSNDALPTARVRRVIGAINGALAKHAGGVALPDGVKNG
jgi:hypothetical protein